MSRHSNIAHEAIVLSSQADIDQRYFTNFIDPTWGLTAKTVDESLTDEMRELGRASRRYYNLQDLFEDISCGLINISKEDCKKFGLDEDSFLRLIHDKLTPETIEMQKKLGVSHAAIRDVMGEGLTNWADREFALGRENLQNWQNSSKINSLGSAILDLTVKQQHPMNTLFHFANGLSASKFYK